MDNIEIGPLGVMATIKEHYGSECDTDSYKKTQLSMMPKGATKSMSYIESRGGRFNEVLFFGLQMYLREYFSGSLTHTKVERIMEIEHEHLDGNVDPLLEPALRKVVDTYGGKFPIIIRSVDEGLVVPVKNVLITVESAYDDEEVVSLVSFIETKLLRVWSTISVATLSHEVKKVIWDGLKISSVAPKEGLASKFCDFGSRAVGTDANAAFLGSGHFAAGFSGSDNKMAMLATKIVYKHKMPGKSIPASEHSVTTSHPNRNEWQLVDQVFKTYAKPGSYFATVIDSYNWRKFIFTIGADFKQRLIDSGATWIFRPDSGNSVTTPLQVIRDLDKVFGHTTNKLGYKVLNNVRVIQGDGIGLPEIKEIIRLMLGEHWSIDNIAFGMGGKLLSEQVRDTQKFAMKACAIKIDGVWYDVEKDPAVFDDDFNVLANVESFKKSKSGRLETLYNTQTGAYASVRKKDMHLHDGKFGWVPALKTRMYVGEFRNEHTLEEIQKRNELV